MPSLLPGFEYDIFISYRQKDNKGDRWVTEFVNALRTELESTFKEDISIYFDENPHDGLLETYNVDKSLEGKLKCLIFIPIVSQTYCDPNSFAWQHEFCAFNKLAKEDQLGRDIKLTNGNVASRILPIKIHDLDVNDKAVIEKEIGILRSIEFIYKEPGVNRPLKSSDNKVDNQNKSDYRNQINKVANAVKEIITAIVNPGSLRRSSETQSQLQSKTVTSAHHTSNRKRVTIAILLLVFISASAYFITRRGSTVDQQPLEKSIAVLPFADMSPNHDQEYFGDGVADEIINVLTQAGDLKVIARTSSFQFKGRNEDPRKIGELLGVSCILEGSVKKSNNQLRITAQLIRASDGSNLWSKTFDRLAEDVFSVQDEIASTVAKALKVSLSGQLPSSFVASRNEEAYKLYQQGRYFYDRFGQGDGLRALELFKESVNLDSSQALTWAYLALAQLFASRENPEESAAKALRMNPHLPEAIIIQAMIYSSQCDFQKSYQWVMSALENGGHGSPLVLRLAARQMSWWNNHTMALQLCEEAILVDPLISHGYFQLGTVYLNNRNYAKAKQSFYKALLLSKDNVPALSWLAENYLLEGKPDSAMIVIEQSDANADKVATKVMAEFLKGNYKESDKWLQYYKTTFKVTVDYDWVTDLYAFTGRKKEALESLAESARKKSSYLQNIQVNPLLDNIRSEPEFVRIIESLGFPNF